MLNLKDIRLNNRLTELILAELLQGRKVGEVVPRTEVFRVAERMLDETGLSQRYSPGEAAALLQTYGQLREEGKEYVIAASA